MASLSYVAVTVTLAAANTNYNLLALVQAIEANCPGTCGELCLQSPKANAAAMIYVGDGKLAGTTRAGYELNSGDSRTYRAERNSVHVGSQYVRTDTPGALLNVEVMLR